MRESVSTIYSAELEGINAKLIEVEVDLNVGLHSFNIVGLADKARLSPRGYYRLLKTARTIADLDKKGGVSANHLAEAFSYRLREEV